MSSALMRWKSSRGLNVLRSADDRWLGVRLEPSPVLDRYDIPNISVESTQG